MADNESKDMEAESEKLDKSDNEHHEETLEEKLSRAEARASEAEKRVKELEAEKDAKGETEKINDGGDIIETFKAPESAPKIEIPEPNIDDEYEIEDWYAE